ncbi:MAG: hypothetical protein ABIQ95_07965 [Bdellovibrionia bacterium]
MMSPLTSYESLILLAGLAGALHVLGPDHWFPTSVLAWQKSWGRSRTVLFASAAYFFHVLLGYFIYLFIEKWVSHLGPKEVFTFAMGLMVVMTLVRGIRFLRVKQVIRMGRKGVGGSFLALSLLGPCEVVIPMFAKAKFLGMGYLIPFVAFLTGTWVVGILLVLNGRNLWNRPLWLPLGVRWLAQTRAAFPLMAGVVLSVGFFFFH